MSDLTDKAGEQLRQARKKADEAISTARTKANEAAAASRERAAKAAETSRRNAETAARKTAETVKTNPLAAVLGGIAIGAIAAALLPKTGREDEILGKVGKKARSAAKGAAQAARDVGKEQLDTLGVNADAAKSQLRDLVSKVGQAAGAATGAAADTLRKK